MVEQRLTRSAPDLAVDAIGGVLAVALVGEVDAALAHKLGRCLERAARGRRPVVVDLTGATSLDKEAIEALTSGYRRLGTRLHLVAPRGEPAWADLRAAGVAHLFIVHTSRPAAMAAASPR